MAEKKLYPKVYADRLRKLLTAKGLTKRQVGKEAKIHESDIGKMERREAAIGVHRAYRLAKFFDVPIRELCNPDRTR